jgi:DNA (cytosine-5)-methyltransferase 1
MSTVTTKDRLGLVESTAVLPMTPEQLFGARRVAKFLRDHGVQFEGELATVCGYVIVDLGMRMLAPRELFRAQGFGPEYVIDKAWVIDPKTGGITEIALTKEQQIRMCGNSVCPPVMRALVAANVPELMAWHKGERKRKRRIVTA